MSGEYGEGAIGVGLQVGEGRDVEACSRGNCLAISVTPSPQSQVGHALSVGAPSTNITHCTQSAAQRKRLGMRGTPMMAQPFEAV